MNRTKQLPVAQSSCYRAQLISATLKQLEVVYSNLVEVDADLSVTEQLLELTRLIEQEGARLLAPRVEIKPVMFYPKETV